MKSDRKSRNELSRIRQTEGISLVFDQDSSSSSASRSRSRSRSSYDGSDSSGSSGRQRRPCRRQHRSSSSSSSVEGHSTSRARSRSHPRCHRMSPRCRCCKQTKSGNRHQHHRSQRRHYRAHSYSSSPNPDRSPISKKNMQILGHNRHMLTQSSPSKLKTYRSCSRSSEPSSTILSVEENKQRMATNAITSKIGVNQQALESVEPILKGSPMEACLAPQTNPVPDERVRPDPVCEKNQTENNWTEAEDSLTSNLSPIRKICFSINNAVAKPTVVAPSSRAVSNVPIRMDSFTSRQPYGDWVPVRKARQTSRHRKHRLNTSH